MCELLRKRRVDVCFLQEVRWRGQGARFVGVKGRKYKLWWSGNNDEIGVRISESEKTMREGCRKFKEKQSDGNNAGFCGGSYECV